MAGPSGDDPIADWRGEFGDAYTARNVVDPHSRTSAFRDMLIGLPIGSVFEVGCNRGHNLVVLRELFPGVRLEAIEPNARARGIAEDQLGPACVADGTVLSIPQPDRSFDLVLAANVLIHVAPRDLPRALDEVLRVSARYILSIEYFSQDDQEIEYRGRRGLLWKRDYIAHFMSRNPILRVLRSGYWDREHGFDRSHWWLLEKPSGTL